MSRAKTADDNRPPKRCSECDEAFDDTDEPFVEALEHYIEQHPESETLERVLTGRWVRVKCHGCKSPFETDLAFVLHDGEPALTARRYCDACAEDNPLGKLVHRNIGPKAVIKQEVARPTQEFELGRGDVTGEWRGLHLRCPACDRATGVDLPRGECKHCGAELSVIVRADL